MRVHQYAAASRDGSNWTAPLRLSQALSDASLVNADGLGQDTGLAAYGRTIWAAWADNGNCTKDNPDGSAGMDIYVTLFVLEP